MATCCAAAHCTARLPQSALYDDYRFVTRPELDRLGLTSAIGTPVLRAYMHGARLRSCWITCDCSLLLVCSPCLLAQVSSLTIACTARPTHWQRRSTTARIALRRSKTSWRRREPATLLRAASCPRSTPLLPRGFWHLAKATVTMMKRRSARTLMVGERRPQCRPSCCTTSASRLCSATQISPSTRLMPRTKLFTRMRRRLRFRGRCWRSTLRPWTVRTTIRSRSALTAGRALFLLLALLQSSLACSLREARRRRTRSQHASRSPQSALLRWALAHAMPILLARAPTSVTGLRKSRSSRVPETPGGATEGAVAVAEAEGGGRAEAEGGGATAAMLRGTSGGECSSVVASETFASATSY